MGFVMNAEQFNAIKTYFLTLFLGVYHLITLVLWLPLTVFELRHWVKELIVEARHSYRRGNKYSKSLIIFLAISVLLFIASGILCLKLLPYIPDLATYEVSPSSDQEF